MHSMCVLFQGAIAQATSLTYKKNVDALTGEEAQNKKTNTLNESVDYSAASNSPCATKAVRK